MPRSVKDLYSKFLKTDLSKPKPVKCHAIVKNCQKCGYHFKKGETVCQECKSPRQQCGNFATPGKQVCKFHGGKSTGRPTGRPLTKAVVPSVGTFTPEEWAEIKRNIEEKKRFHEFSYQISTLAYKKIVENSDSPVTILAASAEYLSKIARWIHEIDKTSAELIHVHTLDELEKTDLHNKMTKIVDKVLSNCVFIFISILKKEISDVSIFEKIWNQIPTQYKILFEKKIQSLNSLQTETEKNDKTI